MHHYKRRRTQQLQTKSRQHFAVENGYASDNRLQTSLLILGSYDYWDHPPNRCPQHALTAHACLNFFVRFCDSHFDTAFSRSNQIADKSLESYLRPLSRHFQKASAQAALKLSVRDILHIEQKTTYARSISRSSSFA